MVKTVSADYGFGPHTFPRGWFVIAESAELGKRSTKPIRYFGKDFALYRGESGRPVLLDAYCPHMGAHLANSESCELVRQNKQIEGDAIRCPFHGWRFTPDGQCDDIPSRNGLPPSAAHVNSYPVEEIMGCIMMWHDPEGNEPLFDPPRLKEWDDPQWIKWDLDHLGSIDVHPVEVMDNIVDAQHLQYTHGQPCEFYENEWRDHVVIQRQGGTHGRYNAKLMTVTWYTGPGILLSKQTYGDYELFEIIANTPVDDGLGEFWHGTIMKASSANPTEEEYATAREVQASALHALASDFVLWKNKRPAINVLQQPEDGDFGKHRKWTKQFYDLAENAHKYQQKLNGVYYVQGLPEPPEELRRMENGSVEQTSG